MLKKLAAVAGATALAGTAITLAAAAPADAATHPAGSIYVHGTHSQAHFWSRADCESHARWMVGQVNGSKTATLLPGVQGPGYQGPQLRFNCYPIRSAQWTYLTAYTSKTGAPILPTDLYVDMSTRLASLVDGTRTVDTDNVWAYEHYISSPVGSVTMATCNGWLNWFVKLVKVNPHARTVGADTSCVVQDGTTSYSVDYAATTATAGLRLDKPLSVPAGQPMLDRLGYDYPLSQTIGSQLKSRYFSKTAHQSARQHGWLASK